MSQRWRNFRIGRGLYARGASRPLTPTDETSSSVDAALWYGWMIARAIAIQKVCDDLDRAGVLHTPEGDLAFYRRVDEMDRERGLFGGLQLA